MTVQQESVAVPQRTLGFVGALNEALDIALGTDDRVFELGEDIQEPGGGGFGVHKGLGNKYGSDRVRMTPISEQAIMGAAVGAAISGMRPVAEIMLMNFVHVCMDQLVNHAAKLRYMSGGRTPVPLTVRTATGTGGGFGAQHSDMLEAQLVHASGLKVVVPSNPADTKGLLLSCVFDDDPCVFGELVGPVAGERKLVAQELRIPQLGVTMTEGSISSWLLDDGAPVGEGQPVYTLATDKTETDIESPAAGTLRIAGAVDQGYPVGTVIGTIE